MFNEEHPLEILVDSASEERYSKLVLRDNTDGSIQVSRLSGCVCMYILYVKEGCSLCVDVAVCVGARTYVCFDSMTSMH